MTSRLFPRFAIALVALVALAASAAAQTTHGSAYNESSSASDLTLSANVQSVLQLNISSAPGGTTVTGNITTGAFSVNLGNINGLGVGAPAAGVSVTTQGGGALYRTPVTLTPVFSGFAEGTKAAIVVEKDAAGSGAGAVREGNNGITMSSTVDVGQARSVDSNLSSGAQVERQVGFYITPATQPGALTATLIYTVTVGEI
jgi:hypothetical protein